MSDDHPVLYVTDQFGRSRPWDGKCLLCERDALRSRLAAVLEWLKDPRLSQWPYMEDGDFYDDLSEQVAAIEKTLCTPDSASVTQEKNP